MESGCGSGGGAEILSSSKASKALRAGLGFALPGGEDTFPFIAAGGRGAGALNASKADGAVCAVVPGEPNPLNPLAAGWTGALNASKADGAVCAVVPGEPNPLNPLAAGWAGALNASKEVETDVAGAASNALNPVVAVACPALLPKASNPADGTETDPPNAEAGAAG